MGNKQSDKEESRRENGSSNKYQINRLVNSARKPIDDTSRLLNHLRAITCERVALISLLLVSPPSSTSLYATYASYAIINENARVHADARKYIAPPSATLPSSARYLTTVE